MLIHFGNRRLADAGVLVTRSFGIRRILSLNDRYLARSADKGNQIGKR